LSGDYVNQSIPYIGVNQMSFGFSKTFGTRFLFQAEAFYKTYFDYPIDASTGYSLANSGADYSGILGASEVKSSGKGRVRGAELMLRANLEKFTFIGSYTFAISEFTNLADEFIVSSWDSRHLFTMTASQNFGKNWTFGLKWRFVGGLPYTPWDLQTSARVDAWDAKGQAYQDFTQMNSLRFDPFHQLDVRLDKKFFFTKWSLMLYFDVQNAYNFQNKGQDFVVRAKNSDGTYQTVDNGTKYVLEEVPNSFGTVLPTLGIMIKF
jgi:hypothetical protein